MIIIINKKEIAGINNKEIIEKYLYTFRNSKQSQNTRKSCLNYFFGKEIIDKDGDLTVFRKDRKTEEWVKCEKKDGKYQYGKDDEIRTIIYFGFEGHVFEIGKRNLLEYRDYLNHLETISLSTKRTKWTILKSFLSFCEDYYGDEHDVFYKFPKEKKWSLTHKEPKSNTDVFLTIEEIKQILDYLKRTNFKYYLIFRLFIESGLRKGGVINLDYDKVFFDKFYVDTKEKNGRNAYYITEELRDYLKIYMKERNLIEIETKSLFLSPQLKRFGNRAFNMFLKKVLNGIGMKKQVTCQVFRRSLNLLRFEMGCPDEIRKILLNHAVRGVNFNNYVKKGLDHEKFLSYFKIWNPFQNIQL